MKYNRVTILIKANDAIPRNVFQEIIYNTLEKNIEIIDYCPLDNDYIEVKGIARAPFSDVETFRWYIISLLWDVDAIGNRVRKVRVQHMHYQTFRVKKGEYRRYKKEDANDPWARTWKQN